jgi:type IV fimbrial biogenesis protein FimT
MNIHAPTCQQGFTLIELLVTLSVLTITLAIGVPSFQSMAQTNRLAAATNDLAGALAMARSEAVRRASPVTVCKTATPDASAPSCSSSASWTNGYLVFVDTGTAGVVDGSDSLLRVFQPSSTDMSITTGSNFSNYVSYLASGVSLGNGGLPNGTFTVKFASCPGAASGMARNVVLNTTGRVSVSKADCS